MFAITFTDVIDISFMIHVFKYVFSFKKDLATWFFM
jgi:hypothetical protein